MEDLNALSRSLDEDGIKALVLQKLVRNGRADRSSVVASEYLLFGLGVRADLVVRGRGLIGIEIKSNLDSVRRLDRQLAAYMSMFDEVIVVLASKHVSRSKSVPAFVEVWELCENGKLRILSRPRKRNTAPLLSYANHMTKADIKKFIIGKPSSVVGIRCKQAFLQSFDKRFGVTSNLFWSSVGDNIERHNVNLLSRFRVERTKSKIRAERAAGYWSQWLKELSVSIDKSHNQSLQVSSVSYIPAELS